MLRGRGFSFGTLHRTSFVQTKFKRGPGKSLFWREARSATLPPHLLPIHDVNFQLTMEGSFGWRAEAPLFFGEGYGTFDLA